MLNRPGIFCRGLVLVTVLALCACQSGGDPSVSYTLGGTISGLQGTVVLSNGSEHVTVVTDGSFTFPAGLNDSATYEVSVQSQPSGQRCVVNHGRGTINGANANGIYIGCASDQLVFISADDGTRGVEPYISDGTAEGTTLLKDINTNTDASPEGLVMLNGITYFTGDDGLTGRELWRTDGTSAGTWLVKDINPGIGDAFRQGTSQLTALNGLLIFFANDGQHGWTLWKSDGTSSGTTLLKDLSPTGLAIVDTAVPTVIGNVAYFPADGGAQGKGLWQTDGTAAGTVLVTDIVPAVSSYSLDIKLLDGALYFFAAGSSGYELWKTDGTSSGTAMIKEVGTFLGSGMPPRSLTVMANNLYGS